jgi:hypothetical protein
MTWDDIVAAFAPFFTGEHVYTGANEVPGEGYYTSGMEPYEGSGAEGFTETIPNATAPGGGGGGQAPYNSPLPDDYLNAVMGMLGFSGPQYAAPGAAGVTSYGLFQGRQEQAPVPPGGLDVGVGTPNFGDTTGINDSIGEGAANFGGPAPFVIPPGGLDTGVGTAAPGFTDGINDDVGEGAANFGGTAPFTIPEGGLDTGAGVADPGFTPGQVPEGGYDVGVGTINTSGIQALSDPAVQRKGSVDLSGKYGGSTPFKTSLFSK